jgi:nucleotide-binding universal stress UspA family protein
MTELKTVTALKKIRILLAYDGSHLALDSVQYIGEVFPSDRTEVSIFYVETKIPRSFWKMERELDFRFKTPEIRASMAARKKTVNLAMEKAESRLLAAGFPLDAIHAMVHIKNQGVLQDIIEESHNGYDALVIGRKGHSKIKDFFVDSLPIKLLGKISTIPLIVVGKKPSHKNIIVAFDGTREIMKAIKSMSSLIKTNDCKLLLCHSQTPRCLFRRPPKKASADMFDLPLDYFLEAGFSIDQVSFEIMEDEKNHTNCILNKARYGDYGTIVIGRRRLTAVKQLFLNRVGNKIFRNADNHVVWIVQ